MFRLPVDAEIDIALIEERHAPELFALIDRNRSHLRAWLPWVDGTRTVDDTKKFRQETLERFARNEGFGAAIRYQGRIAGVIGHNFLHWPNRKTMLGYWLSADLEGRGIMTRAVRAVVSHAFHDMKLNRVEIRCASGNIRSRRIPERLGFQHEGTARESEWLYDHFVDHEVYSLLASQFS